MHCLSANDLNIKNKIKRRKFIEKNEAYFQLNRSYSKLAFSSTIIILIIFQTNNLNTIIGPWVLWLITFFLFFFVLFIAGTNGMRVIYWLVIILIEKDSSMCPKKHERAMFVFVKTQMNPCTQGQG